MKTKSTRLVYIDEQNLEIYRSLPAEDFKEFIMAYLTYQPGDDMKDCFTNPITYALFLSFRAKIDDNEEKWNKCVKNGEKGAAAGKLGGRPRKGETKEEARERRNKDIQPNEDFEMEEDKDIPKIDIKAIAEPVDERKDEISIPIPELCLKPENEPKNGDCGKIFTDREYGVLDKMYGSYYSLANDFCNGYVTKEKVLSEIKSAFNNYGIDERKINQAMDYWDAKIFGEEQYRYSNVS